ncbi:MAG: response regulator [Thermostichales cyanobacterium SZTDM-1c_bins_54]
MVSQLDPQMLATLAQEARQCFLEEDAPDYLATLQRGLGQPNPDYGALMRAAHSLKGGAGLAQLTHLGRLAHLLEDILEALRDQRLLPEFGEQAQVLLQQGVQEVEYVLSQAVSRAGDVAVDEKLLETLQIFCEEAIASPIPAPMVPVQAPSALVKAALEVDLEECLQRAEALLTEPSGISTQQQLITFVEECTLLAETLGLSWLGEAVAPLADALAQPRPDAILLGTTAQRAIAQVRSGRQQYLYPTQIPEAEPEPEQRERPTSVRVPLTRLEELANTAADLLIGYERLTLQQQQFRQASQRLQQLAQLFEPVRTQVQALYDQMAMAHPTQGAGEFDSLELDRYTALHSSLQSLEELIVQVQETRADLDLVNRELLDNLTELRQDLDQLYSEVTQARLVPFRTLSQRFIPQVRRLAQQTGKQVDFHVLGEEVPMEQTLLEQLQNPLTHLITNAIDHGIETPAERIAVEKTPHGTLTLQALLEANQVVIRLTDDGRGIDLERVWQRAQDMGLIPSQARIADQRRETVLDLIFAPGFSTATQVSTLSGRGVGLDSVRQELQRLRGSLTVETQPGLGTCFTMRLPLQTTLLPLLLCQVNRQIIGIPAVNVLEVLPLADLPVQEGMCQWREQWLPFRVLSEIWQVGQEVTTARVGLRVQAGERHLALGVDALVGERQLVLRPFDELIPVPPYLAGGAVLGSGEVVPVLWPYHLPESGSLVRAVSRREGTVRGILVAEDSLATRRSLEKILTAQGYVVVPCRDGQEALEELQQRQEQIGLVLTDIEMPRLNGFDLLQKIRTHSRWFQVPVVMITSRSSERHRQRAFSLGVTAYLTKPVDPDALLAEVQRWLAKSNRDDEHL